MSVRDSSEKTRPAPPPEHGEARRTKAMQTPRRRPVLRFIAIFTICVGLLYAATATALFEQHGWRPYLQWNAQASALVLRGLGEAATAHGRAVSSPSASLSIERGCDAIHPAILFIAATLALPAAWRRKMLGILLGAAFLTMLNLVRIVTLYFVMKHYPRAFEAVHVEVWQAAFIALTVVCWILWAAWALPASARTADAKAT